MYSPKIDETLIPLIYRAAKTENVHMTTWVNRAVENALALREQLNTEEQRKANGRIEDDLERSAA